jgi:predicted RNA-binding protein YlqC (UPF0109 family)
MDYTPIVEYCVKKLVAEPDQVEIDVKQQRNMTQIEIEVAPNDVGKVIGRNGRVINTLRHVINMVAAKDRDKVFVKVIAR